MPICTANTTKCRKCEYRYKKKDKGCKVCPECGEKRRCKNNAVTDYNVCRNHGIGSPKNGKVGGRTPNAMKKKPRTKMDMLRDASPIFADKIEDMYQDKDRTNLAAEMAITTQLLAEAMSKAYFGTAEFMINKVKKALEVVDRAKSMPATSKELKEKRALELAKASLIVDGILKQCLDVGIRNEASEKKIIQLAQISANLAEKQTRIDMNKEYVYSVVDVFALVNDFIGLFLNDLFPRISDDKKKIQAMKSFRYHVISITGIDPFESQKDEVMVIEV